MEYLITFVEGIASFISPCILPVIPIYISYFATESQSMKKSIINSLGFTFGFSIIFILLGVFASTFGKLVHQYADYINIVFGIFLIILSLNYIGILFIKFLNKTKETKTKRSNEPGLHVLHECINSSAEQYPRIPEHYLGARVWSWVLDFWFPVSPRRNAVFPNREHQSKSVCPELEMVWRRCDKCTWAARCGGVHSNATG